MKINIVGIGMTVGDQLKAKVEKKLEKYNRFFGENSHCQIKFTVVKKDEIKAEITVKVGSINYRAENTAAEAMLALDGATDRLERRIRKQKSRLKKRKHVYVLDHYFESDDVSADIALDELPDKNVVISRRKGYALNPMDPEDAAISMELVGHNFFVFMNSQNNEICVIYKRRDGDYGLMEPISD